MKRPSASLARRLLPALVLAAALAACARSERPAGPVRPHTALDATGQPLRAAFNADAGMVRAVILVAPT